MFNANFELNSLKERRILLGVTGSIAAYKALELTRLLVKGGAEVRVVMTEGARKFIAPLSFETLSQNKVTTTLFSQEGGRIVHLELSDWGEVLIVAPATANLIGKFAQGIADDGLTTLLLSAQIPILIAPAMHPSLWENPITQENENKLRGLGVHFIGPLIGKLSGQDVGMGRMVEPEEILVKVNQILTRGKDLMERRVLITVGATEEVLDPIRVLTNPSSGRMGIALAEAAKGRGAEIILIHGRTSCPLPPLDEEIAVKTGEEMRKAVLRKLSEVHLLLMVAAVADYRPLHPSSTKIKERKRVTVELERVPDILSDVNKIVKNRKPVMVGFSVELEDGVERAKRKLEEKGLDLIIANGPASFGSEEIEATLIGRDGELKDLPRMTKRDVAEEILDRAVEIMKSR